MKWSSGELFAMLAFNWWNVVLLASSDYRKLHRRVEKNAKSWNVLHGPVLTPSHPPRIQDTAETSNLPHRRSLAASNKITTQPRHRMHNLPFSPWRYRPRARCPLFLGEIPPSNPQNQGLRSYLDGSCAVRSSEGFQENLERNMLTGPSTLLGP